MSNSSLRKMRPSPTQSNQEAVDAVASYVEIVEDLVHEPFLSKDEYRGFSTNADEKMTFKLGDRAHFRSALISFRRLIMQREPSYYGTVATLLFKHCGQARPAVELFRGDVDRGLKQGTWLIPEITVGRMIDLWINTVFAHGGLTGSKDKVSRGEFDVLVEKYGLGKMEFCFRNGVFDCSLSLINLYQHAARPALHHWISQGHKPSFSLSSPFGRKMRERLPDGTIVIRQATSKFYTEETLDSRFSRILGRSQFRGLKSLFEHIDASATGKSLLALRSKSVREILSQLDYSIETLSRNSEKKLEDPNRGGWDTKKINAMFGVDGQKDGRFIFGSVYFGKGYRFYASPTALKLLDHQLHALVQEFKNED